MRNKGIVIVGTLAVVWLIVGYYSPAFAQAAPPDPRDWSILMAKLMMCFALTVSLTGSAWGLVIAFQALLAGGEENFYKNIAVALMPSTQGIYAMVVFITNMGLFATDPYAVTAKAIIIMLALPVSAVYQGVVCAAGIKSILEGKNTLANSMVSGAMPETYAVFSLVMTFIIK
jgi:F0F1-type ATP synthase membrane subunit c/vacuolar-type H+-ATPase subunit K